MSCVNCVCITCNNYTFKSLDVFAMLDVAYCIIGAEVGEGGTRHLQGYIELHKRTKFSTVLKMLPGCHVEQRRGTQKQAREYCMKDGDYWEKGELKHSGKRTDLDSIRETARDYGMGEVVSIGSLQQIRVAEKYLEYNEESRDWEMNVIWLWGEPGSGKSRLAREMLPDAYIKSTANKWFVGYDRHENVILDDFRDSWMPLTDFLALIDRYGYVVENKGGCRQFLARNIIITSVFRPDQMYRGCGEPVQQIMRRVREVREVAGNNRPQQNDVLELGI